MQIVEFTLVEYFTCNLLHDFYNSYLWYFPLYRYFLLLVLVFTYHKNSKYQNMKLLILLSWLFWKSVFLVNHKKHCLNPLNRKVSIQDFFKNKYILYYHNLDCPCSTCSKNQGIIMYLQDANLLVAQLFYLFLFPHIKKIPNTKMWNFLYFYLEFR